MLQIGIRDCCIIAALHRIFVLEFEFGVKVEVIRMPKSITKKNGKIYLLWSIREAPHYFGGESIGMPNFSSRLWILLQRFCATFPNFFYLLKNNNLNKQYDSFAANIAKIVQCTIIAVRTKQIKQIWMFFFNQMRLIIHQNMYVQFYYTL